MAPLFDTARGRCLHAGRRPEKERGAEGSAPRRTVSLEIRLRQHFVISPSAELTHQLLLLDEWVDDIV